MHFSCQVVFSVPSNIFHAQLDLFRKECITKIFKLPRNSVFAGFLGKPTLQTSVTQMKIYFFSCGWREWFWIETNLLPLGRRRVGIVKYKFWKFVVFVPRRSILLNNWWNCRDTNHLSEFSLLVAARTTFSLFLCTTAGVWNTFQMWFKLDFWAKITVTL